MKKLMIIAFIVGVGFSCKDDNDVVPNRIVSKYSLKMNGWLYNHTDIVYGSRTYAKLIDFMFAAEYDVSQPYEYWTIKF